MEHESSTAGQSAGPHAGPPAGSGSQRPPAAASSSDAAAGTTVAPPAAGPNAAREHELSAAKTSAAGHDPAAASHPRVSPRQAVFIAAAVVAVAAAGYFGIPIVMLAMNTVSTDDAYVNGHFTYVAARVPGQVLREDQGGVMVDDNYRVKKGDVLVRLDPQPYQVIVDEKQAAYEVAKVNLVVAQDDFRGMISKARSARFQLDHAIEDVDNLVALLRSNVAKLGKADADYKRALDQQKTPGVISQQDVDQYKAAYLVALQQVYQTRVGLGLPPKPEHGDLSEVPENLDQTYSTVRAAVSNLYQAAAPLGIVVKSFNYTPRQLIDAFYSLDPSHDVDVIYAHLTENAPSIKLAEAQLHEAEADLAQAKLNLSYCTVYAEIAGVVTGRNVNPGNNVTAGQSLMAVRSLKEIWIDANFKETQLRELRIGQPVDLDVDMYGSHRKFKGRITGFEMGTGSTLALLPPENATGNFVKIVQRLPVRIEMVPGTYDADKAPLFYGLSVTPYVFYKEKPEGPNAGQFLQDLAVEGTQKKPRPITTASKTSGGKPEPSPPRASGTAAKPEKKP